MNQPKLKIERTLLPIGLGLGLGLGLVFLDSLRAWESKEGMEEEKGSERKEKKI